MVEGMSEVSTTTSSTTVAPTNMLDTEVTDVAAYNVIAVGGPAINAVAAELMGLEFPAVAATSGIAEGQALLSLMANGDNWALVVAGYDAENTLAGASLITPLLVQKL